jgi:peptidoglycan L-alanyl-D-glutamate endopeptidase CwlK
VVIWVVVGLAFVLACALIGLWALPSLGRAAPRSVTAVARPVTAAAWMPGPARLKALRWGAIALSLVLLPAGLTFWWAQKGGRHLDGFDDASGPQDARLVALLEGEHLVPPPPLPPDVFLTQEVVQERPLLASADRRWERLDPEFVQRVLRVFKWMRDQHGYEMVLLEGFRSPARQALLAAQGPQVTQAGAWQSYHQHGLAVDCAFWRDGKLVITEREPWALRGYQLFGEASEQLGLTWGGRWKMMDLGHTEWRKPGVKLAAPLPEVGATPAP